MQQPTGQYVYINGGAAVLPAQQNVMAVNGGQQHPQPYVVVMPAPMQIQGSTGAYANYRRSASKVMGTLQIVTALLLLGLNVGIAVVSYNYVWTVATGWWAAPFFIIAGSFGIAAGANPTLCTVVATMVMSIISCISVISVLAQGALGLVIGCDYSCYYRETPHVIMSAVFILCGICELVFALTQSILCCQGCCGGPIQGQVSPVPTGYSNGAFVPCYVHPQGIAQPRPVGQTFQFQPQSGGHNVAMATAQPNFTANEATSVQPPPYNKTEEALAAN